MGDYSSTLASGKKIMTDINMGSGVSHAVVVTGYDSAKNQYIYTDANGQNQRVNASNLNTSFSMAVKDGYTH